MKATCLLLCLVLPQAIVATIFGQKPQFDNTVKPLDFIDQYEIREKTDYGSNELKSQDSQEHTPLHIRDKENQNQSGDRQRSSEEHRPSKEQQPNARQAIEYRPRDTERVANADESQEYSPYAKVYSRMQERQQLALQRVMAERQRLQTRQGLQPNSKMIDSEEKKTSIRQPTFNIDVKEIRRTAQEYPMAREDSNESKNSQRKLNKQRFGSLPYDSSEPRDETREEVKKNWRKSVEQSNEHSYKQIKGYKTNESSEKKTLKALRKSRKNSKIEKPNTRYTQYYDNEDKNRYPRSDKSSSEEHHASLSYSQENPNDYKRVGQMKTSTYVFQPAYLNNENRPMYMYRKNIMIPAKTKSIVFESGKMPIPVKLSMSLNKNLESIQSEAYTKMKPVSDETQKEFHAAFEAAKSDPDMNRNTSELLKANGYTAKTYTVQTDDGYLLTMFRIVPEQRVRQVQNRPVVMLMHGLFGSSDDWLMMGPKNSLAYMLSDAGFDVYLGNERGSKYSTQHVTKSAALPDYWQYNNDDIALHDLPAMIDFALKTSQKEKMHFVGFSQANAHLLALTATRPEYNDKIAALHAMSPMVYMNHAVSPLVKLIAPNSPYYENMEVKQEGEIRSNKDWMRVAGSEICQKVIGCKHVCSNANFIMAGANIEQLDGARTAVIVNHLTSGASSRQMKQVGQAVVAREFQMYDYGDELNTKVYGSIHPPKYDLTLVRVPVTLYSSEQDWLASPRDVERLQMELPNVVGTHQLAAEKQFYNLDFLYGRDAPSKVYKQLVQAIEKSTQ